MRAMDGVWSCKVWPYYLVPSPSNPSAFAPPFSANGVSVPSVDYSAEFEESSDSNNSCYGYDSFSKPFGELDSAPFSKPCSDGYSGFQFMDPPSSRSTRISSPDWPSLDHLKTKPREIEHPCQSPSSWNQFLEFNKGNQGHVNGSDDDAALDSSLFSKIKEAWNVPIFKARPRITNPRENLDVCNPAGYSPCWNVVPAAHSSLFETYEALHPELIDKIDECLASYLEGPKDFHVEIANYGSESCEISNKTKMQNEIDRQEKGLTGLVTKFSVSNYGSQKCNSDGVVNDGRSDFGKQVIEENKFKCQNQNSLYRCKDVGFNVSEWLKCSSFQEAENGLSSPSSISGAPEKASAEAPAPKRDVQMLVKMMHNMSEVLLGHCLTDEFQPNKRDRSILENVIGNLRTCTLKNPEQMIPAQKRLFPELDSGNLAGESPQLQQNSRVKMPHISKVGAEHANVEQAREQGTISDSPRIRGDDTETEKADNMTKAMKRVLSENFREEEEAASHTALYKNLWLEAEAELCSLIYRARFNRMTEVEKYSSKHRDNALVKGEQSKTEADFKLSPDQNSANEVNSSHYAEHMSVLHAANLTEPSGLRLSPNPNEPIAPQHEGEGSQNVDGFIRDSTVFGTNKEAEHDEAFEGTDSPKTQNQDGSDASESLSLMDDTNPETLDSSEADWDLEDNQEIRPGSCHRFGIEFVTDDSSDWELV